MSEGSHDSGLVEEVVVVRDHDLVIWRPQDAEALLDAERFEEDEFIPYWAELWAAGRELAEAVVVRALGGKRVLELGCGLALPSFAAALAGARVTATDWAPEALDLAVENASRNGLSIDVAVFDWRSPEEMIRRGPWDLVLASDVLYEDRNVAPLLDILPELTREVMIADPGRLPAQRFLVEAIRDWNIKTHKRVHHLRRR